MTVAAYRRGMLVADTCYTEIRSETPEYRTRATKISVIKRQDFTLAVVTAGDDELTDAYEAAVCRAFSFLSLSDELPRDLRLDLPQEEGKQLSLSSIVMFRLGNKSGAYAGHNILRYVTPGDYVAIGADAVVALGAMYVGANPVAAVQAAVYHGVMSAAPIESVDSTFFEVRKEPTCM